MERVVADLARAADPTTFDVHVMALGGLGRFAKDVGERVHLHGAPLMSKLSLIHPAALAKAIRTLQPSLVHTHSGTWYKVARAAKLAGGLPLVYTDHGRPNRDPWATTLLHRRAARLTHRIIAVSHALRNDLVGRLGLHPDRVDVVPNGIDLARLDAAGAAVRPVTAEPRGAGENVVFGTLGRLEAVKGIDVLLAAFAQWPVDGPRATLVIGGDGSEKRALEELTRQLGVQDRVRFSGWIDQPALFYRGIDVFVLPSYSEGTSISLLEAMAHRRPTIATDVGGNRAVLGERLAEWLVPSGNPAALAATMATLARSADLRRAIGEIARRRVETCYSLSCTSQRYAEVYEAVVGAHTPVNSALLW
jgi:glycosyltransferase involved in cell wall biosynthesis